MASNVSIKVRRPRRRRSSTPILFTPPTPPRIVLARSLDRAADHALHLGFHVQAERLAGRAAALRGWA